MKKRIVVIGSSNTDMIVNVKRIPKPGETILGGAFSMASGGKGANQAIAAARSGGSVSFVCKLGRDAFGDAALKGFVSEGIDVRPVLRDANSPSGVALVLVGSNGQNSIAVASGANSCLNTQDVQKQKALISGAGILLMQLETPLQTIQAATRIAVSAGVPVILNPAPALPLSSELLRSVSILTPNETEASILSGIRVKDLNSAGKAAGKLMRAGVSIVIITLGAKGVLVATREFVRHVPGFKVKALDTTAAGDTFNGAMATALAEGQTLLDSVRFGCAAAAISVTRSGAQPSIPTRKEIENLIGNCSN